MKHVRRRGFTLTEILIALALVAFLLVGISRIFAMMSTTISAGQSVSTSLRAFRAIQQTLSADFLGYSSTGNIDQGDEGSGMTPLVIPTGTGRGAPFLIINNFRTPTFLNQAALNAASQTPLATDTFAVASLKTRSIDLDGNGVINPASTFTPGGEVVPLYYYGDRNFRSDSISFFGQGNFKSQTGNSGNFVNDISSNDSWQWYGHLRVFNSDASQVRLSAGYGSPGDIETSGNLPNRNNRFAEQFILGRTQGLLVEPQVSSGVSNVETVTTQAGQPVYFIGRRWLAPDDTTQPFGSQMTPIYYNSPGFGGSIVQVFNGTTNADVSFATDATPASSSADQTAIYHCRTDVLGTGIDTLRARAKFMDGLNPTQWWEHLFVQWNERPWVNPYVGTLSSDAPKSLARRTPLLAEGCSQFTVEYAGDFIKQDATTGAVTGITPDGIVDFSVVGGVRAIRWYGMPRDVDDDGVIRGNAAAGPASIAVMQSPDVIYLRDVRGTQSSFERQPSSAGGAMPPANANYHLVTGDGFSQNSTRYTCVWGPTQFETPTGADATGKPLYDVPQMVRIIVEMRDAKGRTKDPVTQEFVFPVRVK